MGAVYLAEDTRLGCRVALKVPNFREGADPRFLERFRREGRLAQAVHHPYVCPVYEVGEIGGYHYLTMPFIEGTPLAQLTSPERPWAPCQAVELVRRLALALQVLHERQIIHRDLKPGNVIVRPTGEAVLVDFGLARVAGDAHQRLTSTGTALGTPAYMSPEQVNGHGEDLGPESDVYSLGVILYQLTSG
jgi:serine/threonine-protein kinase